MLKAHQREHFTVYLAQNHFAELDAHNSGKCINLLSELLTSRSTSGIDWAEVPENSNETSNRLKLSSVVGTVCNLFCIHLPNFA